jgi:hypothetical protein
MGGLHKPLACVGVLIAALGLNDRADAAEFGAGPWIKGATDIFAGVVPTERGFYSRTDVYHYDGNVDATVFNGRVEVGVEQRFTATLPALTYVTPWKLLGGTVAFGVVPSIMAVDVNVGIGLPPITGPLGNTIPGFEFETCDTNLALGDTGLIPIMLGWNEGNFHWSAAMFALAPTGDYSTSQLANASLNRWALMPRLAATYFDPKSGWQVNGVAVYTVNFENDATNYDSGDILNLEGSVVKNFKRVGLGAVGYAMIQTTADSGAGARLGANESRVYAAGPIFTYSFGDPRDPLTFVAKYFHEFAAERTFEGEVVDVAFSFKF